MTSLKNCIPSNLSVGKVSPCISTASFAIQEAKIIVCVPLSHDPASVDASFEVTDGRTHWPIEIKAQALPFWSVADRTDGGISCELDYIPEIYLSKIKFYVFHRTTPRSF